ncbi:MAG: class I SAM-dependent methyltransferase [Bacteroidota bacterium]
MEHKNLDNCPICDSSSFEKFKDVTDNMITKEKFTIVKCSDCNFHFTNPIPSEDFIGKYYKGDAYVSHSSSKKGLINKIYNIVRSYTLNKKVALLKDLNVGNEVLDIGAGTGHFLNACKQKGFSVIGLEPDEDARKFAKDNFKVDLFPLEKLTSIEESSKDIITMWHVLEHVYHLKRDFEILTKILKPSGRIIIAVPNLESYDAQVYSELWAAYDVPRHLYHFRKKDIENLANHFGFKVEKVKPMKFDSFYVSMLSEKYKNGSIVKAFINGFKSNSKAKDFGYSSQIYILSKN